MKTPLLCVPALVSCATAFVVNVQPTAHPHLKSACGGSGDHTRTIVLRSQWMPSDDQEELARKREEQQLLQEMAPRSANPWGMGKTMVVNNERIHYNAIQGARQPAILYLPAFDSPSRDFKAEHIQAYCEKEDYTFMSMDWYGVGSAGDDVGTLSRWKRDALNLISKMLPAQYQTVVIVGGGVGGWVGTLVAMELQEKISGFVGLAADPDFTHNLLLRHLPREKLAKIENKENVIIKWGEATYPVSHFLINDAATNLVLDGPVGGLPIDCPVRLIHGLNDEEVPYTVSLDLARRMRSKNANLYLVKTANHNLDNTDILQMIMDCIEEVITDAPLDPPEYL